MNEFTKSFFATGAPTGFKIWGFQNWPREVEYD